jgi:hypothetical protein
MKRLMKKLEDIMVAVTFAEAGEYDEAIRQAKNELIDEHEKLAPGFKKAAMENAGK